MSDVQAVPVAAETLPVKTANGGVIVARRLSRSALGRIFAAFGVEASNPVHAGLQGEVVTRAAIVSGPPLHLSGREVKAFEPAETLHGVGKLATRDYYDAMEEADVVTVYKFARSGITPEQEKNSESSPDSPGPSDAALT